MKIITILVILISLSLSSAKGSIVYSFAESASGVELNYSGSLNSSALSFQGNLSADGTFIDIVGVPTPGHQLYELENFRPSPVYPFFSGVSGRYSANNITFAWNLYTTPTKYTGSSAFGETFGFYIFQQSGNYVTWMNLPVSYVSGAPITPKLQALIIPHLTPKQHQLFELYLLKMKPRQIAVALV